LGGSVRYRDQSTSLARVIAADADSSPSPNAATGRRGMADTMALRNFRP
jgi:hypothetical protein